MHLILTFFAQILHSTPYFFILLFPTAFYLRSRMTGKYLLPFCKNRLFVSATLISILLFLLILAPSVNLSVDTFPEKRGRLTVRILFFLGNKSFTVIPKRNSPLPSFLSGGQNRNDDRRKNII